MSRRRRGILAQIETDLEANLTVHEQRIVPAADTAVSGPDALPSVT